VSYLYSNGEIVREVWETTQAKSVEFKSSAFVITNEFTYWMLCLSVPWICHFLIELAEINSSWIASLELVQKPSSRYSFVVAAPFLSLFAIKVMFYIERDISSVVMNLPSYLVTIVPGMRWEWIMLMSLWSFGKSFHPSLPPVELIMSE
jgi:hypothetical protein